MSIVNVILDRVIDQNELADRAIAGGQKSLSSLKASMRSLVRRKAVTEDDFANAFEHIVMAHFAKHAAEALQLARASLLAEARAVVAAGPGGVRAVPALTDVELMQRAAERKGVVGGGGETSNP